MRGLIEQDWRKRGEFISKTLIELRKKNTKIKQTRKNYRKAPNGVKSGIVSIFGTSFVTTLIILDKVKARTT